MRRTSASAIRTIKYRLMGALHSNKITVAGPRRPIKPSTHSPIKSAPSAMMVVKQPVSANTPAMLRFLMRDGFWFAIR